MSLRVASWLMFQSCLVIECWPTKSQVRFGSTFPLNGLSWKPRRSVAIAFTCVSQHLTDGKCNTASSASLSHLLFISLSSQLLSSPNLQTNLIINNNFHHSSTINNQPTAIMSTDFGRKVCLFSHRSIMHITDIHPGSV